MQDSPEPKLQNGTDGGGSGGGPRIGTPTPGDSGGSKRVQIDCDLTVKELAHKMHISEATIVSILFYEHQAPRTLNQIVELDLARRTALGMGYELIET